MAGDAYMAGVAQERNLFLLYKTKILMIYMAGYPRRQDAYMAGRSWPRLAHTRRLSMRKECGQA